MFFFPQETKTSARHDYSNENGDFLCSRVPRQKPSKDLSPDVSRSCVEYRYNNNNNNNNNIIINNGDMGPHKVLLPDSVGVSHTFSAIERAFASRYFVNRAKTWRFHFIEVGHRTCKYAIVTSQRKSSGRQFLLRWKQLQRAPTNDYNMLFTVNIVWFQIKKFPRWRRGTSFEPCSFLQKENCSGVSCTICPALSSLKNSLADALGRPLLQ